MYTDEEAPRTGTAVAIKDTVCLRFWRPTFAEFLKDQHNVLGGLLLQMRASSATSTPNESL